MPGNDNKDRTMRTGELLTRAIEQDSWDRIGGQDRRDRTIGQGRYIVQGNMDGTTVAGQSRYNSVRRAADKIVGKGKLALDN
jgi:hypothetical protein